MSRWERQEPVLVGSRAINFWFKDFRRGADEACDWDWLSAQPCDDPWRMRKQEDAVHEIHVDERLDGWHWGNPIATADELYTLKLSHQTHIVNSEATWDKHWADIRFLEAKGCEFIPELYALLAPIWQELHGRRKAKLDQTKDQFFKDAVVRKYDHDSLHRSMALDPSGIAMYERVLRDGSEVFCEWSKFEALDHKDKLILCFEEIAVTALERILIPAWDQGRSICPRRAYRWALRRVCTSLFKNEWALFILRNACSLSVPLVDYRAWHRSNQDKLVLL